MNVRPAVHALLRTAFAALLAAPLFAATGCNSGTSRSAATGVRPGDPWTAAQLVTPADLAKQIADTTAARPMLIHVGFRPLWRAGAIPGSVYAGAGQSESGIAALREAVANVPKDRAIVLYCGCCPWDHCPNMAPAFAELKSLGFTNARALMIAHNLDADWANAGHPLERPKD